MGVQASSGGGDLLPYSLTPTPFRTLSWAYRPVLLQSKQKGVAAAASGAGGAGSSPAAKSGVGAGAGGGSAASRRALIMRGGAKKAVHTHLADLISSDDEEDGGGGGGRGTGTGAHAEAIAAAAKAVASAAAMVAACGAGREQRQQRREQSYVRQGYDDSGPPDSAASSNSTIEAILGNTGRSPVGSQYVAPATF